MSAKRFPTDVCEEWSELDWADLWQTMLAIRMRVVGRREKPAPDAWETASELLLGRDDL